MAKGNLLLGTAKNSVGDVVMYRREGAQITRVRVRNVKNPKTTAQSFQRAIMAPIAKFYSPLSVILERSFEGLSKAKSHNKFNQVNANLARKNKWALPKGTGFFPLPYQLSQGTIPAVSVNYNPDYPGFEFSINHAGTEATTVGQLSADFIAAGYKEGDVVTIIVVSSNNDVSSYFPVTIQFEVKADSTELLTSLKTNDVYLGSNADGNYYLGQDQDLIYAATVIVSRFDGTMWRRSTQVLNVKPDIITTVTADAAVAAAIASYGQTAGDGNPLVYLDGDELEDGE